MQWSKVKSLTEARFAPEVRGKVEVYACRYRNSFWEKQGHGWISIEGVQKVKCTDFFWPSDRDDYTQLPRSEQIKQYQNTFQRERDFFYSWNGFGFRDLMLHCFEFVHMNAHVALNSPNPLLRILALMSSKVGIKKAKLHAEGDMAEVVRYMAGYRVQQYMARRQEPVN